MASDPWYPLLQLTSRLSAAVGRACSGRSARRPWPALRQQFEQQSGPGETAQFADSVAQAVACGHFAIAADAGLFLVPAARQWLLAQADPLAERVLRLCLLPDDSPDLGSTIHTASAHIAQHLQTARSALRPRTTDASPMVERASTCFFEQLLSQCDSRSRRRQGVYYTPPSIVGYIVRHVDQLLRAEFSLADGLADRGTWQDVRAGSAAGGVCASPWATAPFVRILDPAMGTGVFLLEVFDHVRRWWAAHLADGREPAGGPPVDWDSYVTHTLLPRLCGQDVMLPAVVLAQLSLTVRLGASGYRFSQPGRLCLHLGNTLRQPRIGDSPLAQPDYPYTVVLGNPPFSGVSANDYAWIRQLLRGRAPGDRDVANYFLVDGQPLAERKHWLEDDYVKFLRLAHWLIETASAGIVGFVTNHGFLDNTTFRGMRQQLLQTFSRVSIVDLHGNKRTGERPPAGGCDESVFEIEQGVAVSLWRRPSGPSPGAQIEHAELWGPRAQKFLTLDAARPLGTTRLEPHTPYYFLVPHDVRGESEYARGARLSDIMPVNSTVAVTARDSFVVAFTASELCDRIATLCDHRVSDDAIRQRFFTAGRSTRYPPGDTRGWQLPHARQRLRGDADWTRYIRDCLYRPFDRRQIFWAPWMIDWPRTAVMGHLAGGDNLAIVARRQVPASHPCNYFWVTDTIALDGLIRSDNRGSESVFPLFLAADQRPAPGTDGPTDVRRANFSADFLGRVGAQLQLTWRSHAGDLREDQFTALELFHYIYAVLHAPSYRERFATWLRIDFPRMFIPAHRALFRRLAQLGERLVASHLLRVQLPALVTIPEAVGTTRVQPGGPRWTRGRIQVNDRVWLGPVPSEVWEFRVGAHQVCHKWLKDRRGRDLDRADLERYGRIVSSLHETLACMQQIDGAIAEHGGWVAAFV